MADDASVDGAVIGLDLGGTKLLAGLFDRNDRLVSKEYVLVGSLSSGELLDRLASTVRTLAEESSIPVIGVGYGIPTTIDQRTGVAVQAANLPIHNVKMRDELARRTGLPAFIDNDGNVAGLAEQRKGAGATSGARNVLMMTLGTGIGGGIIVDGKIFSGAIGAGAELGHMTISFDGLPCIAPNCPGVGCAETYVSGSALARDLIDFTAAHPESALARAVADGAPAKGELVVEYASTGDADAVRLIETIGTRLGIVAAGYVNIFNPELLVIGGGLVHAQEWLLPKAQAEFERRVLAPGADFTRIVTAHFGAEAGMVGAALLARDGVASGAPNGLESIARTS